MRHDRARLHRRLGRRRLPLLILGLGMISILVFLFVVFPASTPAETLSPQELENQQLDPDQVLPQEKTESTLTTTTTSTAAPTAPTPLTDAELPKETEPPRHTDGLYRLYPKELDAVAAIDVFDPRPRERRVSFERFARCLGTLLAVDPITRTETARNGAASLGELPLLISVTNGNTQDLKALICNLTVSYRYIVLAQTGDTPEMTPFFNLLVRVFDFTQRLVVLQFKESIGFAGAVNAGLREALRHPFDEVPFVHIVHNDVRFVGNALRNTLQDAYNTVVPDKAVIARLEEEVRTEPNEFTPPLRRPKGLRAPMPLDGPLPQQRTDKTNVLVTSALLPDRLRYMNAAERRQQMRGHVSFMFHNSHGHYTSVYLSRLAILVTGFFDENCYPIMFDDTDFRWRASLLGFEEVLFPELDPSLITYDLDCTNTQLDEEPVMDGGIPNAVTAAPSRFSPAAKALLRECSVAFNRGTQFDYVTAKWGVNEFVELASPVTQREPFASEAFSGKRHLPLDAWVVSSNRIAELRRSLRDVGQGGLETSQYDPEVIIDALS